jgi:hypothetical protein
MPMTAAAAPAPAPQMSRTDRHAQEQREALAAAGNSTWKRG